MMGVALQHEPELDGGDAGAMLSHLKDDVEVINEDVESAIIELPIAVVNQPRFFIGGKVLDGDGDAVVIHEMANGVLFQSFPQVADTNGGVPRPTQLEQGLHLQQGGPIFRGLGGHTPEHVNIGEQVLKGALKDTLTNAGGDSRGEVVVHLKPSFLNWGWGCVVLS